MAKAKSKPATPRKRGSVANTPTSAQAPRVVAGGYKIAHTLNVPFLKLNAGDQLAIEVQSVRQQEMSGAGGKKNKEPATIIRSANIDTGEIVDVIAPTVLVSTLSRSYGEGFADGEDTGAWHGKRLLIQCSKREEKRYMDVVVHEIE